LLLNIDRGLPTGSLRGHLKKKLRISPLEYGHRGDTGETQGRHRGTRVNVTRGYARNGITNGMKKVHKED
jgi:hypothetical protein